MMRLLQRRADFPDGGGEDGAAGEKQKQTSARRGETKQSGAEGEKVLLLLLNAQFLIFKGLADENAAAAEVNWAHNGAISCCFVVLLDLANG